MTPGARLAAAAGVLDRMVAGEAAERALLAWSRGARYAGARDRAAVRDLVFDCWRARRSLGWLGGGEDGRALVLGLLRREGDDPAALMTGGGHALPPPGPGDAPRAGEPPEGVGLDLPDWLVAPMRASLGEGLEAAAEALRARAPVHLRVNSAKGTREEAVAALASDGVVARLHPEVRTALQVVDGAGKVARSSAYRAGLVELQDASSQAAVLRLPLRDGMRALDLCAGGGGKALAMGALARLDLMAHDADPARMADLPARAARAGLAVRRLASPAEAGPCDLVLVDAPCSGSGAWRRSPDGKWRLTPDRLAALLATQARLLDEAAALVAPGGALAFATCSVLREEGEARVGAWLAANPAWREADRLRLRPGPLGDGFFQAVLRRA